MADEGAESSERERQVDEVIAGILAAMDAGQDTEPQAWVARYPHLAPELGEFFADLGRAVALMAPLGATETLAPSGTTWDSGPWNQGNGAGVTLTSPESASDHAPLAAGRQFGRYTLLKKIGEGGQGEVWKAAQVHPSRLVALKIIKGGCLASAKEIRRFLDEAELVAGLDHPHIVPVYEVGEHQGHHYFSMKLMLEGGSLKDRLQAYRDDPRAVAGLMIGLAGAVQHAHDHRVIHRDLKPSNILFDDAGQAHLADFGLAKRVGGDVEWTEPGVIVGTAPYMAPEQASGTTRLVTTAVDVYGLGAILYTLLTGVAPFRGNSWMEILSQVLEREPTPPRELNPTAPRDLETICLTCLQKEPSERYYKTANELAEDLKNWRDLLPIKARPTGTWDRCRLWCRRRPALAGTLAALILVTILGLVGVRWQWRQMEEALRQKGRALAAEARSNYFNHIALAEQAWSVQNFGRAAELLAECPDDLRGWEWDYLQGLRRGNPRRFKGHDGVIFGVAFSPDGRLLATAGGDRLIKIWDAATGNLVHTLKGHESGVNSVAFSPTEPRLVSAGAGGEMKLWDLATGLPVYDLVGHWGHVIRVVYSPDGTKIASAGQDGYIRTNDAASGQVLPAIHAHDTTILGLAYSPDGRNLVSADDNGTVKVWDADDYSLVRIATETFDSSRGVSFSPDGVHFAVAGWDGTVRVLDVRTARVVLATHGGHTDAVRGVSYDPRGTRFASAGGDGTVKIWDAATGQEAITLRAIHDGTVRSLAFSPARDFGRLAAIYGDGMIQIWEAPPADIPQDASRALMGHRGIVYDVAFSTDGQRVATASGDHTLRIWEAATGRELLLLTEHASQVYTVAFSSDGKLLASAGADKVIRIWDAETGRLLRIFPGHTDDVWCLAFHPKSQLLASADGVGIVKVWDTAGNQAPFTISAYDSEQEIWCLAFSRDGLLATGAHGGSLKIWDVMAKQPTPRLAWSAHSISVLGLAFSPDGTRIATVGDDNSENLDVRIWDARTGRAGSSLAYSGRSDSVAFSPDGAYLCAANRDGTIKVWDARGDRPEPLLVLYGHTSRVLRVVFSSDNGSLVSAGFDRTARIWNTSRWPRPGGTPTATLGR